MSHYSTRSQAKAEAQRLHRVTAPSPSGRVTDSGLAPSGNPASPSTVRREDIGIETPMIPTIGGPTIDHTKETEGPPTPSTERPCPPAPRAASIASSRSSRALREATRKRIEYEAELELFRAREQLAKKKMDMQLAELEAEEEADDEITGQPVEDREQRVGTWINESPFAAKETPARPSAARQPETPAPIAPELPRRTRRETSTERHRAIEDLADAIQSIAKQRPTPRAFYELPVFDGDPSDWLLFKRRYEESTAAYSFRPYENIARLQMAVKGKAKTLIEDLLRTSSEPIEIMEALDRAYGSPNVLLQCALQKIRSLPRVADNDSNALRSFSSAVRSCVSTLKNIKATGYANNPQLVQELLDKLTPSQRTEYSKYARKMSAELDVDLRVSPTLTVLVDFLEELADTAAYIGSTSAFTPATTRVTTTRAATTRDRHSAPGPSKVVHKVLEVSEQAPVEVKCEQCKGDHRLPQCPDFARMEVNKRWDIVKANKLCFKCIVKKHSRSNCRAKKCTRCGYGHHSLLHVYKSSPASESESTSASESTSTRASVSRDDAPAPEITNRAEIVTNIGDRCVKSLLKIVPVTVKDGDTEHDTYALLDDGATVSLITDALTKNMSGPKASLHIVSASGHSVIDANSRRVKVLIRGPNSECYEVPMRTISAMDLPTQTVPAALAAKCKHLADLDRVWMEDAKPQLLIGQDNWELIVGGDLKRGKSGQPVASLTKLGWVVHGPIGRDIGRDSEYVNQVVDLNALVKNQFDLESLGIMEGKRENPAEKRAVNILDNTTRLTDRGWEVGLLWKSDVIDLPDNYDRACSRLVGIERKMDRDPTFATAYRAQVNRLIANDYARKVEGSLSASPVWHLPHFGVTNINKPGKLRLVFDAADTYKGISLNDNLLSGPDLLNSLLGVLFKFRSREIAFTADIADMFLRIKVTEKDQGAQLFLWRDNDKNRTPDTYVMQSMIFGAASSPTSAIYVLRKNAERFKSVYPEAVEAIRHKHYMDDYLDSVDDVTTALELIDSVTKVHREGNFHIRGWTTNSEELRRNLPTVVDKNDVSLSALGGEIERTLGMMWSIRDDTLSFNLNLQRIKSGIVQGRETPTKREFLRIIMSVFDPLGLVSPLIVDSRILMQRVWRSGIEWDERLTDECDREWRRWLSNLNNIRELRIPRWYGLTLKTVDLHVFGDASEQAYAAVAYFVDSDRNVALIAGKARVAPLKVVSMPRLELQAAILACRLAETIELEHDIKVNSKTYWSDSKTVLHWIRSDPKDYKPYVAHRLAEIDKKTEISNWRWVPSGDNPADEATRVGWSVRDSMWFSGPSFLRRSPSEWPEERTSLPAPEAESELRAARVCVAVETPAPLIDIARFSSWIRAQRAVACALAFTRRLKTKASAPITAELMETAEALLIKQAQRTAFGDDMSRLERGEPLPRDSRLKKLDPMLTDDGLLRVRGRLTSVDRPFDERHPVILDGGERTAQLIVGHYHRRAHHANNETVVNLLREKYWIVRLRPTVKKVAAACQLCRIRRAQPSPPKMGDLPPARLAHHLRPFSHCGLDYFGPMEVTIGRRREKRWGVIFTCLTLRAVHLETAASLSADSAIMALRRFIARRGQPDTIYSDRGTNFVGANTEMKAAMEMLNNRLQEDAATRKIKWQFIPPHSPHMGGCWERLVRSTKAALRATLKERAPREEVLQTLLAEAEAIINSRPLTHVPVDPNDPTALTPNHLLLGSASGTARLGNFNEKDICTRKLWKTSQALADMFWRRWLKEYLPTLQKREKWTTPVPPLKKGDLVLIADANLPRSVWPRGEIIEVFPGADGQVRVVDIRTNHGTLRRPATKVIVLPTSE